MVDDQTPDDQKPARNPSVSAADFVALSLRRWRVSNNAETKLRADFRDDLNFFASNQWPDDLKKQRDADGRPCLTINRLPGFVRQTTNEAHEARPGIEVDPVDNGADPYTAETFQGLIQHVESNSDADVAYDTAVASQARIGRGWFRILPEYASDESFEQELRIRRIRNPFTVYPDPAYQELDGRDMRHCHIVADIPNDEYDDRYGETSPRATLAEFARAGEQAQDWMPEGKTRIAECYSFVPKVKTLCRMKNGEVYTQDKLADPTVQAHLAEAGVPLEPVLTRKVQGKQLTWCLHNAMTILEGNEDLSGPREMPGSFIPVFPVVGEEIDLDGRVDLKGIVRDAKDPQRMANYWKSAMTEAVALAPRAPWLAEEGQIEGREEEWKLANIRNIPVLRYKKVSIGGNTLVPPPQRNFGEPPIQAMAQLSMQAEQDLRATAGYSYDVGSHDPRAELSGKAILARQRQGEVGNSHYQANLAVALRHAGRVLIELLPFYYDTPRVKRILGRDGQARTVIVHAGNQQAAEAERQKQNAADLRIVDLSVGRYDVRVKAGVSFDSQRQQDSELMTNAIQAAPALMERIGDLYFGSFNGQAARRISKRLEKTLPPDLRDDEDGSGQPTIPPQVKQEMDKAQQFIDLQTKVINELTDAAKTKAAELESREAIAKIQAAAMIAVAQSKAISADGIALLEAKLRQIDTMVEIDRTHIETVLGAATSAPPDGTGDVGQAPPPATAVPPGTPSPSPVPSPVSPQPAGPAGTPAGPPLA